MLRKKKGYLLSAFGLMSLFITATAGTSYGASVEVPVKVTLVGSCAIHNNPEINFDDIDTLAAPADHTAAGKLNFTCASGTTYKIEFDSGKHPDKADKRMKHESKDHYIVYGLSTPCAAGTATGSPENCDVTGTISKDASISGNPVGNYNDYVTVTLTATN